jgi:hypothetical protein
LYKPLANSRPTFAWDPVFLATIAIHERDAVTGRRSCAGFHSGAIAETFRVADDFCTCVCGDFCRIVSGTIIHNDNLGVRKLLQRRCNYRSDSTAFIFCRNHYG